jgi:CheY-like chemotaxis protein
MARMREVLSVGASPELPRGRDELVLVVDDENSIRFMARRMLERAGYRVMLAGNGAEAVALYAQHGGDIAIVLTDMAMPVMDGFATMSALRAMNPRVKIIGSSGHAAQESVARAQAAGAQRFIAKPYTAQALLGLLRELLDQTMDAPA